MCKWDGRATSEPPVQRRWRAQPPVRRRWLTDAIPPKGGKAWDFTQRTCLETLPI